MNSSALKPGGWFEFVEIHFKPSSPDNTLPPNSQILELSKVMSENAHAVGLDVEIARKFAGLMQDAGYVDVQEKVFDCPLGGWMPGRRMKEVGLFQRFQVAENLKGISSGIMTRVAGWSTERLEVFLAGVRREMNDKSIHCLYKM
jgi:hypothetical protein